MHLINIILDFLDLGSEIETKIDIGDSGVSNGANIRQLSAAELISQRYLYEQKIFNARQGDYLWVWLRSTGEKFPADSLQRRYLPSNVLPSPGDIAPYLLRCEMGASETGSTAIFTFHDEHRRYEKSEFHLLACAFCFIPFKGFLFLYSVKKCTNLLSIS